MPLTSTNVGDLMGYRRSFERSLRAANKSPRTVETYLDALDQLSGFLVDRGMPTAVDSVTREHIEAYLAELLDLGRAPATVSANAPASAKCIRTSSVIRSLTNGSPLSAPKAI